MNTYKRHSIGPDTHRYAILLYYRFNDEPDLLVNRASEKKSVLSRPSWVPPRFRAKLVTLVNTVIGGDLFTAVYTGHHFIEVIEKDSLHLVDTIARGCDSLLGGGVIR